MSARPTRAAPKPNTRFLKNIIRETNTHNAALKAKELEEVAERRRIARGEHADPRGNEDDKSYHESCSKQRRLDTRDSRSEHRHIMSRQDRHSHISKGRLSSERGSGRLSRHYEQDDDDHEGLGRRHRHRKRRREHRSRSRSPSRERNRKNHRSRSRNQSRDRSYSPKRRSHHRDNHDRSKRQRRSRSPGFNLEKVYDKAHRRLRTPDSSPSEPDIPQPNKIQLETRYSSDPKRVRPPPAKKRLQENNDESDPLEAIVGPMPAPPAPKVHPRGRGALASNSGIDSRFSLAYDPTTDVQPNSASEDDWDQALEALEDRQRWKQQGADRLRAAGFTEQEVEKWEKGDQKREEDVRWRGRGEGREWDRGKVVNSDGILETGPEWGRLKGS